MPAGSVSTVTGINIVYVISPVIKGVFPVCIHEQLVYFYPILNVYKYLPFVYGSTKGK